MFCLIQKLEEFAGQTCVYHVYVLILSVQAFKSDLLYNSVCIVFILVKDCEQLNWIKCRRVFTVFSVCVLMYIGVYVPVSSHCELHFCKSYVLYNIYALHRFLVLMWSLYSHVANCYYSVSLYTRYLLDMPYDCCE